MSEIKNCIYRQGTFELNISDMHLPDEGLSILTGPSGSGKTTFALVLCGLKKPESQFQWIFKNQNLALFSPPDREISLLFQTLELFPNMSAKENILFPAQARKQSVTKTQDRFSMLQKDLNLFSFIDNPVYLLSGGEKQRVALARALIVKPRLLILDEPFTGLDDHLKQSVIQLFEKILSKDRFPILLITHDWKNLKSLAKKIFFLKEGQLTSSPSL